MNPSELAWLRARLGEDVTFPDLQLRWDRLHDVRAVALEVLAERRAAYLADPLRLVVQGVTVDNTENLRALERLILAVTDEPSPDGRAGAQPTDLAVTILRPAHRYR